MVANCEASSLARKLIRESCDKHRIGEDQLTLHADRGSSMKSKAVALLLSDPGVTRTHSRPHVSDDNPFSEAQFKTLKYRPGFPERFGCIQDARAFGRGFFDWYNKRSLPFGPELADAGDGPLRTLPPCRPTAAACPGLRAWRASRTFRQRTTNDRRTARGGLDQPICKGAGGSLNSERRCLKVVDTLRSRNGGGVLRLPTRKTIPTLPVTRPFGQIGRLRAVARPFTASSTVKGGKGPALSVGRTLTFQMDEI